MVKKEKARKVEDMLIMNAQRGAIGGQIDEAQLIEMLESINEQTEKETKVRGSAGALRRLRRCCAGDVSTTAH
eukprot:749933-Hanusia_phi.AAC.10